MNSVSARGKPAARRAKTFASSSTPAAPSVANPSLADRAYRVLEEKIVTLELEPGAVLSESALSDLLEIGRTPVREALHRLGREGLVTVLPRRGILVAELDVRAQLRLLEVRREIERLMARRAAERASVEERATFRRIGDDMIAGAGTGDDLLFMRLDLEFNSLLVRAARNEFLAKTIALMAGLSRRFWYMHNLRQPDLHTPATRHAAIAHAIAAGDAEAAAAASDALLDHVEAITRRAIDW